METTRMLGSMTASLDSKETPLASIWDHKQLVKWREDVLTKLIINTSITCINPKESVAKIGMMVLTETCRVSFRSTF
jgi:hypothetical protein